MEKVKKIMERVYDPRRLQVAWEQVRRNAGAAGVDGMTVKEFESKESKLLELIHQRLQEGSYRFKPARRALIPKPGSDKKKRKLGIPVVMDRIVSQSLNLALDEIFDSHFTESNFGFRKGKSQHMAIYHLRDAVAEGYEWCASVDLENFFDEIPHTLIFRLVRRKIADERLMTLIARALKAGVMVNGRKETSTRCCPQGSPVSPILSNIVLHELDCELERRGHRYCRWADDFLIVVRSERAAHRTMENTMRFLENQLHLPVNHGKCAIAPVKAVEFLGFSILRNKIRVSDPSRKRFKKRIRELTVRNNPHSMHHNIQHLNQYLQGWVAYFGIQEFKKLFQELDWFIRSRLRSMQLKKWKNPRKFQRMMIRAGIKPEIARKTWVRMRFWQSTERQEVRKVLNNGWFRRKGLVFLDAYTRRYPELQLSR